MKTTKRVVTSIIILVLTCVLLFTTLLMSNPISQTLYADDKVAQVRTASLTVNDIVQQDLEDEFDVFNVYSTDSGIDIIAKKNFSADILSELDLIGIDEENDFTVRYEVQYIENEETVLLTAIIEGVDEIPVIDTIPGLVTYNSIGEADVLFSVEGEYVWLSELQASETLNEIGWLSSLFKAITNAVKEVVKTVVKVVTTILAPAIRIASNVAVKLLGPTAADIGAVILNMSKDEQGIYHANFNCWQQYFGYTDLYDVVFDAATSMRNAKFAFDANGDNVDDYILWAWKGDYLNLGAGAELGIYKRWEYSDDIWKVDKSLAMKMTLSLDYKGTNIINWQPTAKQWWITGFNWKYQNVNRDDLEATYTVQFNTTSMYNAFKKYWDPRDSRWEFSNSRKASFTF